MQPRRLNLAVLFAVSSIAGGAPRQQDALPPATPVYVWERLTEHASFPPSYNYPVHVAADGRFVALHPQGTWISIDGARWVRGTLPFSGTNSAYLPYVQHEGATWALGSHTGNYLGFTIEPVIRRTSNYAAWETVGSSATSPRLVFYAASSFRGALWIIGGYDGTRERATVWRSTDGLNWRLLVANAPWSARAGAKAIVFRGRLYLLGGGRIDGPNSNDVWSTGDGIDWVRETAQIAVDAPVGYSPLVLHDQLWLVGANRSGRFSSEMLVSEDGKAWRAVSAPWSPRGGVAVWTDGNAMYLTGGKYSTVERGEIVFAYRNDVWRMSAGGRVREAPLRGALQVR